MKKLIRILLIIAVGCGLYYLGAHFIGGGGAGKNANLTPVIVEPASLDSIYDSVQALGTAYSNESINITAAATDTISEIRFSDGQQVKKGDVIVLLEQDEEQAQIKAAQAQLAEHKRELVRLGKLLQNKAASKREYDERQTMIEITDQEVKETKARIEDRTLRAPFDGVLGLRRLSIGGLVQPGQIITTLDDISKIKLDFSVPDIYLDNLHQGMEIEARSESLGANVFRGMVETIDTRVDPETRSVMVRAIIPNENDQIRPGVLMEVVLLKGDRQAITVREEAILQRQDKHYLMIVDQVSKKVRQQVVEIGTRNPGKVEINKGINVGDLVIIRGIDQARPDMEVNIQETWSRDGGPAKKPDEAAKEGGG